MKALHPHPLCRLLSPVLCILVCSGSLFLSCESSSHVPEGNQTNAGISSPVATETTDETQKGDDSWKAATNLADLEGRWESSNVSLYEYPFKAEGKKYLRVAWKETDDTVLWQNWAAQHDMDMETLWQMRYACLSDIYRQVLPAADANGTQYGIKISRLSGRILTRTEMLVSERLLLVNLGFFHLSPDRNSFIEQGSLRLASDVFSDLSKGGASGTIYRKKHDN